MKSIIDSKIAIVGIGGVGGYLAGMLCQAFPHTTFVARNKRKEHLLRFGLDLHSDYHGEIHAVPEHVCTTSELSPQDYIFLCVKNYSLEQTCQEIAHAVTSDTVISPVMNGVDPGDRIRACLPQCTVIDSLIYIVSFANPDYSITQQGDFANLFIGRNHPSEKDRIKIKQVSAILSEADIDHEIADDIEAAIWKKYMLNCAYNVATTYFDEPIGPIRADRAKALDYENLVYEAYAVALAKGIHVKKEDADWIIHRFYYDHAEDCTSSLMRDFRAEHQSELETFSGYIVHEAKRLCVDAPVSQKMYDGLWKRYSAFSSQTSE